MRLEPALHRTASGWTAAVHGASPSDLVCAFDPALPHVVIEGHSPVPPGWHSLEIPLAEGHGPIGLRSVRRVRFDLLLSPQEAIASASELDGADHGGLFAWQAATVPTHLTLSVLDGDAREAARRSAGVTLMIDLPHRKETAVLWSPERTALEAAIVRLSA